MLAAAVAWSGCDDDSVGGATPTGGGGLAGGSGGAGGAVGGAGGVGGSNPSTCNAQSCDGCCAGDGSCQDGRAADACGYDGYGCADCEASGRSCKNRVCVNPRRLPNGMVDDSTLFVATDEDVERTRRDLIRFIWGPAGLPTGLPAVVNPDVPNPAPGVTGFERVDELQIPMDLGFVSVAYHFHPASQAANGGLVVFHQGHSVDLGANGGFHTLTTLLEQGYAVLALQMPLYGPNQGPVLDHDEIIALASSTPGFDPIKFFLEPVAIALNHARQAGAYDREAMTGISGGGWTTTLYAAIDPSIQVVLPVAGTLPLYLRVGGDKGDAEQYYDSLYEIAGYPDLYVLGSVGMGRRHVQILSRYDSCCFAGLGYRIYEPEVASRVEALGSGSFRVFLDETHLSHQISPHAVAAVMLYELDGGAVRIADDVDPFYGEYTTIGGWAAFTGEGFGDDLQAAPAGNGDLRARWSFPVEPGTYRVAATWVPAANRATNATYVIQGDAVSVDQQLAPGSFDEAGAFWQELWPSRSVTGNTLVVELSNLADGYVIADAIRIERLGN